MPIDPDAYMRGAIPTLSRGGSWAPPTNPGHPVNKSNPSHTSFSRTNSVSPLSQTGTGPQSGPFGGPLYVADGTFSSIAGSQVSSQGSGPSLRIGPVHHPGWAVAQASISSVTGSQIPSTISPRSTSSMSTNHNPPKHIITPRLYPAHQYVPPSVADSNSRLEKWQGGSWEQGSGAPKFLSRESEYPCNMPHSTVLRKTSIHPVRKRADSLPSVPPPPRESQSLSARKESTWKEEHRERHTSGSARRLEEPKRDASTRPGMVRRSTYQGIPVSPLSTRDVVANAPVPQQKTRPPRSSLSNSPHPGTSVPLPSSSRTPPHPSHATLSAFSPASPYVKVGRPPMARRHTHDTTPSLSSLSALSHDKDCPNTLHHPRLRRLSSPGLNKQPTSPATATHSPSSTHGSAPKSPRSLPSSQRTRRFSRRSQAEGSLYHFSSLSDSLPSVSASKVDPPMGYISPNSKEGYDRYSTHPAAPAPDRLDHHHHLPSDSQKSVLVSEYVPVGYAEPTKDVEWNRDGPAMKTHGVAWKKHSDGLVMRAKPDGPRWEQARPPRVEVMNGGGWWESGGQGH